MTAKSKLIKIIGDEEDIENIYQDLVETVEAYNKQFNTEVKLK